MLLPSEITLYSKRNTIISSVEILAYKDTTHRRSDQSPRTAALNPFMDLSTGDQAEPGDGDAEAAAREALQSRLLVDLFAHSVANDLILKGGMAMRSVFGSVRYTKDIDLDSPPQVSKTHVQGLVKRAIKRVLTTGILENSVVTEPKQTDSTLIWNIAGRVAGTAPNVHLTIEISRLGMTPMDHVIEKEVVLDGQSTTIKVIDGEALAVSKVFALTSPNRSAARNLYDLGVLIDMDVKPSLDLFTRRGAEVIDKTISELWSKIEAMSYQQFEQDLKPYLPTAVRNTITSEIFDGMQLRVGEHVQSWLRRAKSTMKP